MCDTNDMSPKDTFFDDVSSAFKIVQEELNNKGLWECKTREERLESRETQYKNVVYWYHVSFSNEILNELNKRYISISGFNIMPYRITKKDVEDAVKKRAQSKILCDG